MSLKVLVIVQAICLGRELKIFTAVLCGLNLTNQSVDHVTLLLISIFAITLNVWLSSLECHIVVPSAKKSAQTVQCRLNSIIGPSQNSEMGHLPTQPLKGIKM